MKTFLKILLTALAVIFLVNFLTGVTVVGYSSAIFLTLPATIVTFGLFIFVINAVIILLADKLVSGFAVSGFWTALLFSILLSIFRSFLFSLLNDKNIN